MLLECLMPISKSGVVPVGNAETISRAIGENEKRPRTVGRGKLAGDQRREYLAYGGFIVNYQYMHVISP